MECKKTGAHIYLTDHGAWAVCDAFLVGVDAKTEEPIWLFRITSTNFGKFRDYKHFTIHEVDHWFKDQPISTLIANKVTYHGYEGVLI